MNDEYKSLIKCNIWILIPRHQVLNGHRILDGKWVYHQKISSTIDYKARWVAKDFRQEYGVDYFETFTAVAKPISYKITLMLAAHYE